MKYQSKNNNEYEKIIIIENTRKSQVEKNALMINVRNIIQKKKNMMKISRIRTSCERRKISLTYQSTRFRKSKNVFSIMMHRYENNRNMFWKISDYDQKSLNRICIRNSRIWRIQKTNKRRIIEYDSLCYFMNKKLSVVFKRLWK